MMYQQSVVNGARNNPCNPCANDPLYNPPPCPPQPCPPCQPRSPKNKCKCKKCCALPLPPPCEPPRDPCPLKSFCDPGLTNTCVGRPIINPNGPRHSVTTWKVNLLISNKNGLAANSDADLINPWGIAVYNNQLFVVNGTTDSITNYDLFGNKIGSSLTVRDAAHNSAFPTGIAINCASAFAVSAGTQIKSALFLTASELGTVHAFNPLINNFASILVLNQRLTGEVAVYRGLAIANGVLYLADFKYQHIDVFDSSFNRLLGFHFIDGDTSDPIPLDFTNNNIVHIGCYMYILYARKDPVVPINDLDGPSNGYISVFNLDGSFVRRFTSRGVLNSPWAMIPAPCECGFPPGSFLVGNNGDGRINIFDCNGRYVGPLLAQSGLPVSLPGLWGLAPHYTDFSEIFFAQSPDEDETGFVGSLTRDQIIQF